MAHSVKASNIPTIAVESCSLVSNEVSPVITMEPRPAKEQQEEMEENTTIPLIEYQTYHTKNKILKKKFNSLYTSRRMVCEKKDNYA